MEVDGTKMERKIRFLDGKEELVLPVTPPSFEIEDGVRIETVNLTGLGDIVIPGHSTLTQITINSFFPASPYPFSSQIAEPYSYAAWFSDRSARKKVLRLLVDGTGLNVAVLIDNIRYGERDGTNDVYYSLSLQRYRYTSADGSAVRETPDRDDVEMYTVKEGDTLSIIAAEKYGDMWLYPKIMSYNGLISDMIHPGDILALPPLSAIQ